jgi:hypothetical protein
MFSLKRAEGFFFSLDVLYGFLGINTINCNFCLKNSGSGPGINKSGSETLLFFTSFSFNVRLTHFIFI